jgi:hypothetical protein
MGVLVVVLEFLLVRVLVSVCLVVVVVFVIVFDMVVIMKDMRMSMGDVFVAVLVGMLGRGHLGAPLVSAKRLFHPVSV